jgi:carboxymethylenebutenolidase
VDGSTASASQPPQRGQEGLQRQEKCHRGTAWARDLPCDSRPPTGSRRRASTAGTVPKDADAFLSKACPIVGSFGAKDWTLRGVVSRLERALSVAGLEHDVKEYPAAEHGFLNNHDRADVPALSVVMGKITGAKYHEPSAQDARRRIVSFFNTHLKS